MIDRHKYFDLQRLPGDIDPEEAIKFFKQHHVSFVMDEFFTVPLDITKAKRGDEEFHEQVIYEIRKNRK